MTRVKKEWEAVLKEGRLRVMKLYYRDKDEEEYLRSLASKYVVAKTKNYSLARSIVLDIHIIEEYYMTSIIVLLCSLGGQRIGLEIDAQGLTEAIGNVDCFKKISIIKKLNILSAQSIEIVERLNILRNAFAHGYKEGHKGYNYKGKSIFEKEGVDLLVSDHTKLTRVAVNFLRGDL